MFSGGDYSEVARWLGNFVNSHAKREHLSVEGQLEAEGAREGKSYGVRLRLGDRLLPAPDQPAMELSFAEVAGSRGGMAWCHALAGRVRALARELAHASAARDRSA